MGTLFLEPKLKGTSHHSQNGQKSKRDTGERTSDSKRKFLPNMGNRVKQVVRRIVKEREKSGLMTDKKQQDFSATFGSFLISSLFGFPPFFGRSKSIRVS
jgi:hypothetical protein